MLQHRLLKAFSLKSRSKKLFHFSLQKTFSTTPPSQSLFITARRRLVALGAASFVVLTLVRFEEWLDASVQTLDSSFAAYLGNNHPFGEYNVHSTVKSTLFDEEVDNDNDDDEIYPNDDLSLDGGLIRRRTRDFQKRRNISYSSFLFAGRIVDVCVMKSEDNSSIEKPVVVVNAGSIAAARPYLIAISRAGLTAVAYTHGGLSISSNINSLKGLKKPSLDQFGTSFGPFSGVGGGFFLRAANTLIQGIQSTGDPLPIHSEAMMPSGYPARMTERDEDNSEENTPLAPTSESQSSELSAVLSHLRVNRVILVSTSFHWLSTIKTALRNKNNIAGLVCVDPTFPTSSPRVLISQNNLESEDVTIEERQGQRQHQDRNSDSDSTSNNSLQLTWLEKAMLRDIKNIKFPHPLTGPVINLLGVNPSSLLAPQQLASPSAMSTISPIIMDDKAMKTSASGRSAVSSLISSTLSPSLQVCMQPVAVHGSDLYEATFVRSQVIGAAYGKSGLLPPWTLFRQEASGTPLLTRLFGLQGKETADFFKALKTQSSVPITSSASKNSENSDTSSSSSSSPFSNNSKESENKLTQLTFELDVAASRSPFLDIIRLSTVLSNNGSGFRSMPSSFIQQPPGSNYTNVPGMITSFVAPEAAYSSDGAAIGAFLWNLTNSFIHRSRALETGTTFSPCPLEDARMAYTTSMLEALRAENHYYLLTEQAGMLFKQSSSKNVVGKTEKEAATAIQSIIDDMAKKPISCSSLSGNSPLKGALIRISLAQAGTTLPLLGKKDLFGASNTSISSVNTSRNPPVISDLLINARTDALSRAAAAYQISPTLSPLLLSKEVDEKSARLLSLLRKTILPLSSSSSSSSPSSSSLSSSISPTISNNASSYAGILGIWTAPIAFNLSPSRWNIPLHAIDRFGEAVGKANPALLMSASPKQTPELEDAYSEFHAITTTRELEVKSGREKRDEVEDDMLLKEKDSMFEEKRRKRRASGEILRNSLSAINIPSFQGLLSFTSANLKGASTPAQWKTYFFGQAGRGLVDIKTKRPEKEVNQRLNLPTSTVPFPVSMLLTELTDKQLVEPVSGPPQLDYDSEHEISLLGVDSTVSVSGITAPPLGTSPNSILLQLRMLIQAHQKLQKAAWQNALPEAVVSLPAETAFDVALNLRQSVSPKLRGTVKRISSSSWLSLLSGYGGEVELKVSNSNTLRTRSFNDDDDDDDDSIWPENTPKSTGSQDEPLSLISDAVAYGPAQPYRPSIIRVVNEVIGIAEVDEMRS